ncbi:T9SS sorting signal type C domain-containing protein [Psychroserpens mesophilus]|uniref:T9SS sorting signal type C domain-containing protein n=1 Tax=Psychroserpens mesophilus TaxID=325473 RepID=UPI000A039670|nr:T9SS sorting signal type C domain-containing protein [Psychroserpens mesophilus]
MIKKLLFFFLLICTTQLTLGQAPGEDCASATPLTLIPGGTLNTGLQSTAGLSNSYTAIPTCVGAAAFPGFAAGAIDGVYSINVTTAGDHTFSYTVTGSTFKTLSVFPACPVVPGDCLGGFYTAGNRNGTVTINLPIGTYYIVVDGATFGGTPQFTLTISAPAVPPSNDLCADAIELYSNVNCLYQTFTNEAATDSGELPAPGCSSYLGGDVWFSYEVNSTGDFTIDMDTGVITDSGLAVYSGTCGGLTLLACDDDSSANGFMSSITITGRAPGEIVYIRVWEFGNDNNGTFDICITTPVPVGTHGVIMDCPGEFPRELTSDIGITCGAVAGTTSLGNTINGNLNAATDPIANQLGIFQVSTDPCQFDPPDTANYTATNFTVTVTGDYVFEMATSAAYDGMGYIVEAGFTPGICGPGFIAGDDDSNPVSNEPQITANLTAGVNYTLITTVFGFGPVTISGPYTWNISFATTTPQPDWFTTAVGGTSIGSGDGFNPVGVAGSGLPDTNTPGIYSFWVECPTTPGVRVQADYVIGMVWDGSASADWFNPLNWNRNFVPSPSECVFIPSGTPNDPIINDDLNADGYNITIETGASVNLSSDGNANSLASSLTLQDAVIVQAGGSLIIPDGASLIQVSDSPSQANSGDILLNRNTSIRQTDYVYWSSPVQGFDVSDVYGAFTPTNRIYEWLPTTATGYFSPPPGPVAVITGNWNALSSGNMSPGKGYIIQGPTNHTATVSTATATFNGVPNNGVITQALDSGDYTGGTFMYSPYGTDMITVTDKDDNWNLIGNPYPSALDADAFLTHPSNSIIEGAVHIWTHGTQIGNNGDSFYDDFLLSYSPSDYITYNLLGVTNPNPVFSGNIGSGQSFFVLALNDNESGSVTFNNSMRGAGISNTDFYRNADSTNDTNAIERHRIWLDLIDNENGLSSNILVGYIEGATEEKDRLYDAFARESNNLSLYSKINDERMIIQGKGLPFDQYDQIPLGAVIPVAGQYTLAIKNVDGLFLNDDQNIYLEDTHTNLIHNLKAAPYVFTVADNESYEDRFVLRYTDDALSINETELNALKIIAPKGDYIKINSYNSSINSVTVYDLLGRSLIEQTNIDDLEFVINNHNLSSGSYVVKVTLSNGLFKTQKVILKR